MTKYFSTNHKKNISIAKTGHSVSSKTRQKIAKSLMGNKNSIGHTVSEEAKEKMRGPRKSKVGYLGLHARIRTKLGQPGTCWQCGRDGLSGRQIHWANISHKYKEDDDDWARLCQSCHSFYDKGKLILDLKEA